MCFTPGKTPTRRRIFCRSEDRTSDFYDALSHAPSTAIPVGTKIVGRYTIGEVRGSGRFGVVHCADDQISGRVVALKILGPKISERDLRRETVALRALRLDGVAQLLDEGTHDGRPFLVMQLFEGTPFPQAKSLSWPELAPIAQALLRVLAQLHAAGVMHLDLKPDNVLVEDNGTVRILDLGLASGPVIGQAISCDSATDLRAAGWMLQGALHPDADLPRSVQATINALCTGTPPDAWAAYLGLGGIEPKGPSLGEGPLVSARLRAVLAPGSRFDGREALIATILDRAKGQASHAESLFKGWLRSGTASQVGGQFKVRLEHDSSDLSPQALYEASRDLDAFRAARTTLREGQPKIVSSALQVLTLTALETRSPKRLDEALYWIGRTGGQRPILKGLLIAARHVATQPERSQEALHAISNVKINGELQMWYAALQLQQTPSIDRAALLRRWRNRIGEQDPASHARILDWQGIHAYGAGRFKEAAQLHQAAITVAPTPRRQLPARLNASAALIELGDYVETRNQAQQAAKLARSVGHRMFWARAEWMIRSADWRAEHPIGPDPGLVDGMAALGNPYLTGLVALGEAAGAWRLGHIYDARTLAQRAEQSLSLLSQTGGARELAAALIAVTCHRPMPIDALAEAALSQDWGDIDWQILGLVAQANGGQRWRQHARAAASRAPDPDRRREVFRPREIITL